MTRATDHPATRSNRRHSPKAMAAEATTRQSSVSRTFFQVTLRAPNTDSAGGAQRRGGSLDSHERRVQTTQARRTPVDEPPHTKIPRLSKKVADRRAATRTRARRRAAPEGEALSKPYPWAISLFIAM